MNRTNGSVLVVDDDESVLKGIQHLLELEGHQVETTLDAAAAIEKLKKGTFDVVLSDISMPGLSGIDLLRAVRGFDLDLPVLIMTGAPEVATAIRAIEYGALRYLIKPLDALALLQVVDYAVRMCRMARLKREALSLVGDPGKFVGDRAGLERHFTEALETLWMAFQPIVWWSQQRVYAYEALLRSGESTLASPGSLLLAAEKLGRLHQLGRAIRRAAAAAATELKTAKLFVNLHTVDLDDDELYSATAPLSKFAQSVVLEITERAPLDAIKDVPKRVKMLREMGYQIALDDLGAGYSGLTSLAQLQPEVVKLDMSLVRDVDLSPTKQKLVGTMTALSKEMGMRVVAEGVETAVERDVLVSLGCDLLQGYLFARPGKRFIEPELGGGALGLEACAVVH